MARGRMCTCRETAVRGDDGVVVVGVVVVVGDGVVVVMVIA